MSEIRPQTSNHRNPANAPSAAAAPTRTHTSEESGMQMVQDDTQSTTALLRKEISVDTLETKSLCCEAAGIIALSSSTTEALVPHEKLREAATPNATINAQKRPLAQPVVGYDRSLNFSIDFLNDFLKAKNIARKIIMDLDQTLFEPTSNVDATSVARADRSQKVQNNQAHIIGALQQKLVRSPRLQRTQTLEDIQHSSFNQSPIPSEPIGIDLITLGKQMLNFLNEAPQLKAVGDLSLILVGFSSKPLKPSLPGRNSTRSQDGANRTNCLHPGRCSLTFPRPRKYPPTYQHHQRRQHQSLQQSDDGNSYDNSLGQHLHLLAFNGGERLPHRPYKIQGEA